MDHRNKNVITPPKNPHPKFLAAGSDAIKKGFVPQMTEVKDSKQYDIGKPKDVSH